MAAERGLTIPNTRRERCVESVSEEVRRLTGMEAVRGDPATRKVTVTYRPGPADPEPRPDGHHRPGIHGGGSHPTVCGGPPSRWPPGSARPGSGAPRAPGTASSGCQGGPSGRSESGGGPLPGGFPTLRPREDVQKDAAR